MMITLHGKFWLKNSNVPAISPDIYVCKIICKSNVSFQIDFVVNKKSSWFLETHVEYGII